MCKLWRHREVKPLAPGAQLIDPDSNPDVPLRSACPAAKGRPVSPRDVCVS